MTPIGPIGEQVSKVTTTVPTNHIRWNSGILEQKWETKFYFPERPSTFAWRPIDTFSEPKSLVCANKGIVKTLREEIDRLRAQLRPFLPTDGAVSKPVFSFEEQSSIHNWGKNSRCMACGCFYAGLERRDLCPGQEDK